MLKFMIEDQSIEIIFILHFNRIILIFSLCNLKNLSNPAR